MELFWKLLPHRAGELVQQVLGSNTSLSQRRVP